MQKRVCVCVCSKEEFQEDWRTIPENYNKYKESSPKRFQAVLLVIPIPDFQAHYTSRNYTFALFTIFYILFPR